MLLYSKRLLTQHNVVAAEVKEPCQESLDSAPVGTTAREQRYMSGHYFFEYLVVVSLKKSKEGAYEPQITYQFPKVSPLVGHTACLLKGI